MKKYFKLTFIAAFMVVTFAGKVSAQTDQEMFLAVFKMEKRAYFLQNMSLKDEQFNTFWDIYSGFEKEREDISKQRIQMLKTYVEKYTTMTDADADAIMKQWLSLEKKEDALRIKYYGKMKKALGAKVGAHFTQLDDYIQTAIRFEILDELPFIGEFN